MAPSSKKLEEALLDGTYEVYSTAPDDTTVNKVRSHVEEKLGLEDGFFSAGNWKSKSKALIKERVDQLLDGWVPEAKEGSDSNAGTKRRSSETASSKPKRQKRAPKPKKPVKKVESDLSELSELSEMSEVSEEEKPQPKKNKKATKGRKSKTETAGSSDEDGLVQCDIASPDSRPRAKKATKGRKSKTAESGEEDNLVQSDNPTPDPKPESKIEDGLEEDKAKDEDTATDEPTPVKEPEASAETQKPTIELGEEIKDDVTVSTKKEGSPTVVVEEDEYSDVIDEPAKPKRKKKEKGKKDSSTKAAKPSKPSKSTSKKVLVPDDPQEAEVKRLQSHLIKCGIRKLWHNELKQYGDDSRAKIRHLKKMLSDAGMDGRFSEAKAREIKENRELMAEAEAAQEMNRLWGMGGRGRRSKGKATKEEESEASEGEAKGDGDGGGGGDAVDGGDDNDDDEVEPVTYAARRRRAQAELAFLGDDSDSE